MFSAQKFVPSEVFGAEDWRAKPGEFEIEGFKPIHRVLEQAQRAWSDIVLDPSDVTLVVSHKSVLRALVCTALGLGPAGFRAVDMHNSGALSYLSPSSKYIMHPAQFQRGDSTVACWDS